MRSRSVSTRRRRAISRSTPGPRRSTSSIRTEWSPPDRQFGVTALTTREFRFPVRYGLAVENSVNKRDNAVHSVDRAISILQVLALRGPSAVTEIATELSIHKSTVFRLLATLEGRGLVDQNAIRGRYQLGYGVVRLASGATRRHDLSVISR